MVIILHPDDLAYDFEGDTKRPKLNDFPAIENIDFGPYDVILYKRGKDEIILKATTDPEATDISFDDFEGKGLRTAMIMLSPKAENVRLALTEAVAEIAEKIEKGEKWEEAKMGLVVGDDVEDEKAALEAFKSGNFQAAWVLFNT